MPYEIVDEQGCEGDGRPMDEPLLAHVAEFTARHGKLIGAILALSVLVSLAIGVFSPRAHEQSLVIALARTPEEGPLEPVDSVVQRVERYAEDLVLDGALAESVELDASPMTERPPLLNATPLLLLNVQADTVEETRRAVDMISAWVIDHQQPMIDEERARLNELIKSLERSTAETDLIGQKTSTILGHLDTINELFQVRYIASPLSTTGPEVVAVWKPEPRGWSRTLGLPLSLGLAFGLAAGYFAAFARVALRSVSSDDAPVQS